MLFDPATAAIIALALVFVLMIGGVHIGVALGLGGILGMYLSIGLDTALAQVITVPFASVNNFTLAVIPLFILMVSFAYHAMRTTAYYSAEKILLPLLPVFISLTPSL